MKKLTTLKKHGKLMLATATMVCMQFTTEAQVATPQAPPESMKASLFQLDANGTTALLDGNVTIYDDVYLDGLGDDALKLNNFGENFGILREGTKLSVEQRKKINAKDTTFFVMWNMLARQYRLKITTQNLDHTGLEAILHDSYTATNTPVGLNDLTTIDFSVDNNAGSYATDRFKVIFKNPTITPVPVMFTSFTATLSGMSAQLLWSVENENAVEEYQVEYGTDGINFTPVKSLQANNTGGSRSYSTTDQSVRSGDNYYRIKARQTNASDKLTSVVKLTVATTAPVRDISIYPNPVVNRMMNIMFPGTVTGKYKMILYSSNGTAQPLPSLMVNAGQSVIPVPLPKSTAPGVYRVKIMGPDNSISIKTINVL